MARTLILLSSLVIAGPVIAQTLSPAPKTGLWETDMTMRLNGQDIGQAMRQMQEQMLQSVPAEQRAQMTAMMRSQGGPMMGGAPHRQCLTAAMVAQASDPKQALAEMHKQAPQCRFEPVKTSASSVSFKGRCDDPKGFSGDVTGEYTLVDDKASTWRFTGKGRMPQAGSMPGLKVGPDGLVEMLMQGRSRWVSAQCGNVK